MLFEKWHALPLIWYGDMFRDIAQLLSWKFYAPFYAQVEVQTPSPSIHIHLMTRKPGHLSETNVRRLESLKVHLYMQIRLVA